MSSSLFCVRKIIFGVGESCRILFSSFDSVQYWHSNIQNDDVRKQFPRHPNCGHINCASLMRFGIPQNSTLMMRMISSSGEKIVSKRGTSGAAVATARREMSSRPNGTARISRTMA